MLNEPTYPPPLPTANPRQMMNKMEHDDMQMRAVKNTSDIAKKAFTAFMDCVEACQGPDCVSECKVDFGMGD